MKLQELGRLIRFINMMMKSDEFNFIKENKICNIKNINSTYLWKTNVYYNEDILFLIDSNENIYYSFKLEDFKLSSDVRENINNFMKNITPIRKSLGRKGYKYKNIDNFTCDILQELMS